MKKKIGESCPASDSRVTAQRPPQPPYPVP